MSSFTENLYLKRQLKQLQEENRKLKQILSEADEPASRSPDLNNLMGIFSKFDRSSKAMGKMTPEEAFQEGVNHAREHKGLRTPDHYFNNKDFVAGFNSVT